MDTFEYKNNRYQSNNVTNKASSLHDVFFVGIDFDNVVLVVLLTKF